MLSLDEIQRPCQPKVDAKHPGVAVALDELQDEKSYEVTGRALKDRVAMWVGKKDPASFQEQIPCNLQVIV